MQLIHADKCSIIPSIYRVVNTKQNIYIDVSGVFYKRNKMKAILQSVTVGLIFMHLLVLQIHGMEQRCESVPGRLLAKFRENTRIQGNEKLDRLLKVTGCTGMESLFKGTGQKRHDCGLGVDRIYSFRFSGGSPLSEFQASGLFEYVEPDYIAHGCASKVFLPNDQYFYRQWPLNNDATFTMNGLISPKVDADIDMPEAWDIEQGDSSLIIAILDSGCKMDHPEFAGRIWHNPGEIPGNGIDDDNNGYIDDVNGWDFVNNDNDPTDDNGHGTSVTGVIGANGNNSIGFSGVNLRSRLMIVKVNDSLKNVTASNMVKGIDYALHNGAKILNLSFAFKTDSETKKTAISLAYSNGISICAGTGNDGDSIIAFPAGYEQVIAVGGSGPDDSRWIETDLTGSNYGIGLDIVAPGVYVFTLDEIDGNDFDLYSSGTSLSTAFATGVASLLLSRDPSLTPDQVKVILRESADDQVGDPLEDTPGWDKYYGAGRLNAFKALQMASGIRKYHPKRQIQVVAGPAKYLNLANAIIAKSGTSGTFDFTGRLVNVNRYSKLANGIFIIGNRRRP